MRTRYCKLTTLTSMGKASGDPPVLEEAGKFSGPATRIFQT